MSHSPEEHRKDPQYKRAKKQGYRARSAFKLFEIQKRFNIFKRTFYILDIGSTPGSWLQVAKKFVKENLNKYKDGFYHRDHYKIMGVDLKKVSPINNVKTIKMDIYDPQFESQIEEYFNNNKLDLILSDASINKSGNKFSDHTRQIKLCYKILDIVIKNLKYKGNCVFKCFQGEDFTDFYNSMKNIFFIVKSFKPKTSQKKSNEIYLIGLKKKN